MARQDLSWSFIGSRRMTNQGLLKGISRGFYGARLNVCLRQYRAHKIKFHRSPPISRPQRALVSHRVLKLSEGKLRQAALLVWDSPYLTAPAIDRLPFLPIDFS